MLVIGAKGFAKEVLEVLHQNNQLHDLCFFDDVNENIGEYFCNIYPIIKSNESAKAFLNDTNPEYTIGIGNPILRRTMHSRFEGLGGKLTSVISKSAEIGSYNVVIAKGCNILSRAVVSNGSILGVGCLVYYNAMITHDCIVGDFVEFSPGATIL